MIRPLLTALALLTAATLPDAATSARAISHASNGRIVSVCATPRPGYASCLAERIAGVIHPTDNSQPPYSPADLHAAYSLPLVPVNGSHQTVAIVDAGGDTSIQSDIAAYDARYNLPPADFRIVNERGNTSPLPASQGWEDEIALDVEMVHAICQSCSILLVEADAATLNDLAVSVATAYGLGATEISNSYGGSETGASQADLNYDRAGVAITVSSGDSGYGASWPASLPTVISVGGTSLYLNADGSYNHETAWSKTGSGCSMFYQAQSWQLALPNWTQTQCGNNRAIADVSAVADPNTGVAVLSQGQWGQYGGTSASSPIVAGAIALAGGEVGARYPSSVPYQHTSGFRDVTLGSNGSCGGIAVCVAGPGYDGPTGLGSPNGLGGFQSSPVPTPEPPTATPLPPTSTPVPTATVAPPTDTPQPRPTVPLPSPTLQPTIAPPPTATATMPPSSPTATIPAPPLPPTSTPRPRPTSTPQPCITLPIHFHYQGGRYSWTLHLRRGPNRKWRYARKCPR